MAVQDAVTAVRRFGLGARPGDLETIGRDARGWVLASLTNTEAARLSGPGLGSTSEIYAAVDDAKAKLRDFMTADPAKASATGSAQAPAAGPGGSPPGIRQRELDGGRDGKPAKAATPISGGELLHRAYMADAAARIECACTTEAAFLERLVMFWSNHFCVSGGKGRVVGIVGAYEREAIRPHVLGRFSDMLLSAVQHPAMLMYLDNVGSKGPNSSIGLRQRSGLNENLAREILELHTLGVDGGYTQADVTNLARLITGWSVVEHKFKVIDAWQEPGSWTVLGKTYASVGAETGRLCLMDIARHPATAQLIARKLATHFVADHPDPALVAQLAATFTQTDGDLAAVARALIAAPAAWQGSQRKSLPPYDFAIALVRGFGVALPAADVLRLAAALGQPLWKPNSPKGFPDGDDAWLDASAVRERLRVAEQVVRGIDAALDPREAANALLAAVMSEPTRIAIARAETRAQGLVLLMLSPEFQRR